MKPRADEHKVQWLSASGTPAYLEVFRKILHSGSAHWPRLDRSYFDADHLTPGGFSRKFYTETAIRRRSAFAPIRQSRSRQQLANLRRRSRLRHVVSSGKCLRRRRPWLKRAARFARSKPTSKKCSSNLPPAMPEPLLAQRSTLGTIFTAKPRVFRSTLSASAPATHPLKSKPFSKIANCVSNICSPKAN